ncbi:uncharacterized [Tachysurus ichikawai]
MLNIPGYILSYPSRWPASCSIFLVTSHPIQAVGLPHARYSWLHPILSKPLACLMLDIPGYILSKSLACLMLDIPGYIPSYPSRWPASRSIFLVTSHPIQAVGLPHARYSWLHPIPVGLPHARYSWLHPILTKPLACLTLDIPGIAAGSSLTITNTKHLL